VVYQTQRQLSSLCGEGASVRAVYGFDAAHSIGKYYAKPYLSPHFPEILT
jgi:hypothetical protein